MKTREKNRKKKNRKQEIVIKENDLFGKTPKQKILATYIELTELLNDFPETKKEVYRHAPSMLKPLIKNTPKEALKKKLKEVAKELKYLYDNYDRIVKEKVRKIPEKKWGGGKYIPLYPIYKYKTYSPAYGGKVGKTCGLIAKTYKNKNGKKAEIYFNCLVTEK